MAAICLGGLLSYVLYSRVATEAAVLAATRTIYRGETISATDLTAVTISGTAKITTVPARDRDALVGRKAIFDLVEDSLVPAGSIADAAVPSTGRAVVGLRLTAGRAPVGLLTPGSPVRLVSVPSADQAPSDRSAGTRTFLARVVSQSDGNDGASILVNVDVAAADAPAIALLSAQDRLAVLRDADR